jgi:RHS repeat-associated protein
MSAQREHHQRDVRLRPQRQSDRGTRAHSNVSYTKPSSITQGTRTIAFLDDTEHQRFKQITPEETTLYITGFGVLAEVSNAGTTSAKWTDYLSAGSAKVGMRVLQTSSETLTTRYFHTDHLGSISIITNESGVVQERLSYDAWGKRRYPDGTDDPSDSITSQSTRGFTGEEELSVASLVHLNGRVYDPVLARFTSADPITESPFNTQGWNRYSYVGNDPLAYTDPSGHCFLGCFWQHIGSAWNGVTNFFAHNAIAKAILQIAATAVLSVIIPGAGTALTALGAAEAGAGGAIIANGLSGGSLSQTLKAGLIAGVTAFAFFQVGDFTGHTPTFGSPAYAENVVGHALVGCASSAASGGSCGSGALSGAVGSALSPLTNDVFPHAQEDFGQRIGGTIFQATAGGLASVAGGGKFANGAITGAFGYLSNGLAGRIVGGVVGGILEGGAGLETGPADGLILAHGIFFGGELGSRFEDWLFGNSTFEAIPVIDVSIARFGEAATHIVDAQAAGQPNILTIDRLGADANRTAAIGDLDSVPGKQLDEYPPAMFREGGGGASVRAINPSDNMSAGAYIGNSLRSFANGTRIQIRVVP